MCDRTGIQIPSPSYFPAIGTLSLALFLTSCGGGGGNDRSPDSPATVTGSFVDSAVQNIAYSTALGSGFTDEQGNFPYRPGDAVTFSIGGITLPPVLAKAIVTPIDLVPNAAGPGNSQVVNIARLLQTLDTDGNPDNGIQIADQTHQQVASQKLDFSSENFETEANQLLANNGITTTLVSAQAAVSHLIQTLNNIEPGLGSSYPVANAGTNQSVMPGDTVTLDGSGSFDYDGDTLNYQWTLSSKPEGSIAQLSDTTIVNPSFIADLAGEYSISLIVNDGDSGKGNSLQASTVTIISTGNTLPIADAGKDVGGEINNVISLDGRSSNDEDGDPLSYQWSLISQPAGANASLTNADQTQPLFTPTVAGTYIAQLIVNDGNNDSLTPDIVDIIIADGPVPPRAKLEQITFIVGPTSTVTLDGSNSLDANGNPLNYQWAVTSSPPEYVNDNLVNGVLINENTNTLVSFPVGDKEGTHVIELTVSEADGSGSSTVQATIEVNKSLPRSSNFFIFALFGGYLLTRIRQKKSNNR